MPSASRTKFKLSVRRSLAAAIFGSAEDAPVYCASLVVVLSAITLTLINVVKCFDGEYDGLEKQAALLAGALGYLFYARTRGRPPRPPTSANTDQNES